MGRVKEETRDNVGIMARVKPDIKQDFIKLARLEGRTFAGQIRYLITQYVRENRFRLQEAQHDHANKVAA
jgi:hypothetical protein